MDLLFAAEQYAAAQATAVAAAQYYANAANAAMSAAAGGHPGPRVMLQPGSQVVGGQVLPPSVMVSAVGPQGLVALPTSQTWSGGSGPPPPPPISRGFEHDDREEQDYTRDRRRDRSRERPRRKRSRSRSRERARERLPWRERAEEDRRRDRSPGRWRDRSPGEEDWRHAAPNNTVMIRGLPQNITEQHVQDNIQAQGLDARDIRLIRKKDTGASRGFAFVEFASLETAQKWMESQQGWIRFEGTRVSMQYSVPRDQRPGDPPRLVSDWICAKCGVQNFRRRDACFKCSGPRTELDCGLDPEDEQSTHPTNTVLLSGLDALTTEDGVLNVLGPLTKLPLKAVRIGRDTLTNTSRGVCYVEMNSVVDSMFLHNQLLADPPMIDGRRAEVGYHKQGGAKIVTSASQNNAAANSALAAAQWTNNKSSEESAQRRPEASGASAASRKFSDAEIVKMAEYSANLYAKSDEERRSYIEYYKKYYREGGDAAPALAALQAKATGPDLGTVVVNGVEYQRYPTPDVTKYQYDDTSGYYYDKVSTLYYDANSQYYFNPKNSKFCYWDAEHSAFLPAPEGEGGPEKAEKTGKEAKKSAKKIQKDMEKWARKQESRKEREASRAPEPGGAGPGGQGGAKTEDIAFNILQRKEREGTVVGPRPDTPETEEVTEEVAPAAATSAVAVAELQLTDWEKLACLLCARQFQTREKLQKHNTMSDLHTRNLEEWRGRHRLGGAEPAEDGLQYRDRAKERRNKYGDEDVPAPNKFKEKYMRAMADVAAGGGGAGQAEAAPRLDESNVGNRMLQKMGWKDGLGLGKKNQGRTDIIQTKSRQAQSGLGTSQPNIGPNDCYKDIAKKTLFNRYNDNE